MSEGRLGETQANLWETDGRPIHKHRTSAHFPSASDSSPSEWLQMVIASREPDCSPDNFATSDDGVDYQLFPKSGRVISVTYGDPQIKLLFRQNREKAMTVGDRDAVAVMGQILHEKSSELGIDMSRGEIMRQLEKEYGFDVDAAMMELDIRRISQYLGCQVIIEVLLPGPHRTTCR
jgi:hypothetical protein